MQTPVTILRNFLALFLVLLFNVPVSASLQAVAEIENPPVFCSEPIAVVVTVSWQGEQDDYRVGVPKIVLPEGLVRTGVSSRSSHIGDEFRIVYTFNLKAANCGEFSIDAIEVDYFGSDAEEPFTKKVPGISFIVQKRPVLRGPIVPIGATILGISLVVLSYWGVSRRKRHQKNTKIEGTIPAEVREAWKERLESCRRLKAHGEVKQFFDEAPRLHEDVLSRFSESPAADMIQGRFSELVENVKYGGGKPQSGEVEAYFQALEQQVEDALNR